MTASHASGTDSASEAHSSGWVAEALREHDELARRGELLPNPHDGRTKGSPQPLPGTVREEQVLERIDRARRSRPRVKEPRITMSHGAGGKATRTLVEAVFLDAFRNPLLEPLEDAAQLHFNGSRVALTTDSYVVSPLFFPGGNIGDLAVNGTVNDLSVSGAVPLYLSAGFILEEGFDVDDLRRIVASMHDAADGGRRSGGHRRYQGGGEGQGRRLLHQHRRAGHRRAQHDPGGGPGQAGRRGDGVRADRRPRHHDHAGPRRARHRGRRDLGHGAAERAGRRPAGGDAGRPRACATRPAAGWPPS